MPEPARKRRHQSDSRHGEEVIKQIRREKDKKPAKKAETKDKKQTKPPPQQPAAMSWGYDKDNGPSTWVDSFPVANGPRQSPVDIRPSTINTDNALVTKPLTIKYGEEGNLQLENPGLSFKINISGESVITGGPLESKYKLVQFHFHWAHEDQSGSEHTVDGKMYPSELHFVHYNADKYASFGEAVTQPDGLAVIGVFIKAGKAHDGFKTLSDNSSKVKVKAAKVDTGAKFNPASLLPDNTAQYWTYEGSLTTPPLCESVRWIVMKNEIEISKEQLNAMRSLTCDECGSKPIPANYRPPQPLGKRVVTASF